MFRFAPKKIFTTLIAGSIAIAGMTASPARADSEDVAKVIVGIAALSIIAKALEEDGNVAVHHDRSSHWHRHPNGVRHNHPHQHGHHRTYGHTDKSYYGRKDLPAECVRRHETHRGRVVFLGRQCLKNNFRYFNSLPNRCRVQTQTYKGMRYGYQISCLRDKGYRLVRH